MQKLDLSNGAGTKEEEGFALLCSSFAHRVYHLATGSKMQLSG